MVLCKEWILQPLFMVIAFIIVFISLSYWVIYVWGEPVVVCQAWQIVSFVVLKYLGLPHTVQFANEDFCCDWGSTVWQGLRTWYVRCIMLHACIFSINMKSNVMCTCFFFSKVTIELKQPFLFNSHPWSSSYEKWKFSYLLHTHELFQTLITYFSLVEHKNKMMNCNLNS